MEEERLERIEKELEEIKEFLSNMRLDCGFYQ